MQPKEITELTDKTLREIYRRWTGCDDRSYKGELADLEPLYGNAVEVQRLKWAHEVRMTMIEMEYIEKFIYWFRKRYGNLKLQEPPIITESELTREDEYEGWTRDRSLVPNTEGWKESEDEHGKYWYKQL